MINTTINFFSKAWNGKQSLPIAFFALYYLPRLFILVIVFSISQIFYPEFYSFKDMAEFSSRFTVLSRTVVAVLLPYTLFTAICVWRCAVNSSQIWLILSRIAVVMSVILSTIDVIATIMHFLR